LEHAQSSTSPALAFSALICLCALVRERESTLELTPNLYKRTALHRLRAKLARSFLLRIKRATHRSPAQLIQPKASVVLVVAPHMDDEVIGCGGTLLLLRETGAEVHVAYVSDSSAAKVDVADGQHISSTRRAEAPRVGTFMDFSSTRELGFPDGQLARHESGITDRLSELIEEVKPELLFCPFPGEEHSDHMSCASAAAAAAKRTRFKGTIAAYEVCSPLWPNVVVDISAVSRRKEEAIRLYDSQIAYRDYAAAALGLNRFRGLGVGVDYAESFFMCQAGAFTELTSLLDRI
jgi:N-acetylglucosamine malate deacetylase 1